MSFDFKFNHVKIKSNTEKVIQSMGVVPNFKEKHWSVQRRLPAHIRANVTKSRAAKEIADAKLVIKSRLSALEKPRATFLVCKQRNKKLIPVGFPNRRFSTLGGVLKFAKSIGRETVRCIKGAIQKDFDVSLLDNN